jgi:hypothetical protein
VLAELQPEENAFKRSVAACSRSERHPAKLRINTNDGIQANVFRIVKKLAPQTSLASSKS